jgi:hypothetical protein
MFATNRESCITQCHNGYNSQEWNACTALQFHHLAGLFGIFGCLLSLSVYI